MAWVAADRALRMGELLDRNGSSGEWRAMREDGAPAGVPGGLGPGPGDLRTVLQLDGAGRLGHGGFVRRYAPDVPGAHSVDGAPGRDGAFVACSL